MALTTAQATALAQNLRASSNPTVVAALAIRDDVTLTDYCNSASTFVVWSSTTSADTIINNIVWANFTPVDTPDSTALYTNRILLCQTKQMNLQMLLKGTPGIFNSTLIPTGLANVRQGFNDALTNIPAGTSGALLSAGWANVRLAMQRFATNAEKVFATGTGTQATPGVLGGFEGNVSLNELSVALNTNG